MLNMIDTQDKLKNFSEEQLISEMQMPSGSAPQFMVLGEIERRKRMRQDAQRQEGLMQPTVAQEAVSAAGVPQQGIAGLAQSLAPKTDMTQNTGVSNVQASGLPAQPSQPQRMAKGGIMRLAPGGTLSANAISAIANLKTNYPNIYELNKDDPETLEYMANWLDTGGANAGTQTDALGATLPADDGFVPRFPGDTRFQQSQVAKNNSAAEPVAATVELEALTAPASVLSSEANAAIMAVQAAEQERAAQLAAQADAAPIAELETAPVGGLASVVDASVVDYASLPAWKLAQLADEGDDQAINQMRLNELRALSDASNRNILPVDPITQETLIAGPLDALTSTVYSATDDVNRAESTITTLEEFIRLNPENSAQATAQLAQAKAEAERARLAQEAAVIAAANPAVVTPAAATGLAALTATELNTPAIRNALAAKQQPPVVPVVPVASNSPSEGIASSGSGSGQGRIADLIASRKKQADQDKWLALAQAGMSLMSTGDFGKAGQEGLAALMAQRESMNKFDTDMIKLESDLVLNNARLEAERRSGVTAPKYAPAALVTAAQTEVDNARAALEAAGSDQVLKSKALTALELAEKRYRIVYDSVASQYPALAADLAKVGTASTGRKQI